MWLKRVCWANQLHRVLNTLMSGFQGATWTSPWSLCEVPLSQSVMLQQARIIFWAVCPLSQQSEFLVTFLGRQPYLTTFQTPENIFQKLLWLPPHTPSTPGKRRISPNLFQSWAVELIKDSEPPQLEISRHQSSKNSHSRLQNPLLWRNYCDFINTLILQHHQLSQMVKTWSTIQIWLLFAQMSSLHMAF